MSSWIDINDTDQIGKTGNKSAAVFRCINEKIEFIWNTVVAELLDRLFAHSPQLKLAYELRETLIAIFDQDLTKQEATEEIQEWR